MYNRCFRKPNCGVRFEALIIDLAPPFSSAGTPFGPGRRSICLRQHSIWLRGRSIWTSRLAALLQRCPTLQLLLLRPPGAFLQQLERSLLLAHFIKEQSMTTLYRRAYIDDFILIEVGFDIIGFTHMPDEHPSCQLSSARQAPQQFAAVPH